MKGSSRRFHPNRNLKGEAKYLADDQWWSNPLRIITIELPPSDIKDLDIEETVTKVADLGANVAVAFALSYVGARAYYQSTIAPHHPDLGRRDILRETIEHCRKQGLKVLAYVNCIWGDSAVAKEHPEWAQRKSDGQLQQEFGGASTAMCPNGPYKEYLQKVVLEIVSNYDVDGVFMDEPGFQSWCACENCAAKLKKDLGLELPTKQNWSDPNWLKFIEWRYKSVTEFASSVYRTIKGIDSKKMCFLQFHFPISSFLSRRMPVFMYDILKIGWRHGSEYAGWYIPMIYGENLRELMRHEDVLSVEDYRSLSQLPVWWLGASVRYAKSIDENKPVFVLIESPYIPWNLVSLPEAELKVSIASVVANGAQPWFAMYGPGVANLTNWKAIGESFNKLRELEEYLEKRETIKFAALLFSERTVHLYGRNQVESRCLDHFHGFYKALSQSHVPFDVIHDDNLASPKTLEGYKVLVLPNAACLSQADTLNIQRFVKNGGGVVATFRSSLFDDKGNQLSNLSLNEVLGVDYLGSITSSLFGYARIRGQHEITEQVGVENIIPCVDEQLNVKTKGKARSLCSILSASTSAFTTLGAETSLPTIVVSDYGKGRTVYFPGKPESIFLSYGWDIYRALLERSVKWTCKTELPLTFENLPNTVEVQAYYQPANSRFVVHLVNYTSEMPRPINETLPVCNVNCSMRIPTDSRIRSVKLLVSGKEPPWNTKNGYVTFTVPKIDEHEIICISWEQG
nr:beta-galactosidase trimerization domain-containing protein [Candidatus Njordarchaeum guaymaensis]